MTMESTVLVEKELKRDSSMLHTEKISELVDQKIKDLP